MTGPVTTEALVDALVYLRPNRANKGTISLDAVKTRNALAVIEMYIHKSDKVHKARFEYASKCMASCLSLKKENNELQAQLDALIQEVLGK